MRRREGTSQRPPTSSGSPFRARSLAFSDRQDGLPREPLPRGNRHLPDTQQDLRLPQGLRRRQGVSFADRRGCLFSCRALTCSSPTRRSVRRCIRFSTLVTRVFHTPGKDVSDEDRWTVESSTGGGKTRETFSHVGQFLYRLWQTPRESADEDDGTLTVIANGHYSDPFIPYVQGLWNYKGKITHS